MSKPYYAMWHPASGQYWKMDVYGDSPLLSEDKDFFKKRYDFYSMQDRWWHNEGPSIKNQEGVHEIIPFEQLELIEWNPCRDFYYAIPIDCQYEIGGTAIVSTKTIHHEDGQNITYLIIQLISGYVNFGWSSPNDEGYSYEHYAIEKGKDEFGQSVWLIEHSSGGKDCDGRIDHFSYYKSKGGKKNLNDYSALMVDRSDHISEDELIESLKKYRLENEIEAFRSPMIPSDHEKSYNRDHSAERMGY